MSRPIDADALKDVIQQHDYPLTDWLNSIDNGMFTIGIFQAIDQMPTLSPDDVRVKATLFGGDADGYADGFPVYSSFVCSACGEEFGVDDGQPPPFNYCPECGAKFNLVQGAGYTEKKSLNKEAN